MSAASSLPSSPALRPSATTRPTSFWLGALERRAAKMHDEYLDLSAPMQWGSPEEQRAAVKFFNAAFRAEESGLRQAHELAGEVREWDADLARVLELYGNEEGWHRELVTDYLSFLGGSVQPMGRITGTLYRLYARAKRMETIVLTNLMFEVIGATTYRMALTEVKHASARQMLKILARDESFHVPLNVHFLRHVLSRSVLSRSVLSRGVLSRPGSSPLRLKAIFLLLFFTLLLLPFASRPKAFAFDHIERGRLVRGYARELGRVFINEPDLGLSPPIWFLRLLGISRAELLRGQAVGSVEAAEMAVDRENVEITAL